MKKHFLIIFGYVMIFVYLMALVFQSENLTRIVVGNYFGLPADFHGWSHEEIYQGELTYAIPCFIILFIQILVFFILCWRWKKKDNESRLTKTSLIQLIFGLFLCGASEIGATINLIQATSHYLVGKYEMVSQDQTWYTKKERMKKHDPAKFQIKKKAQSAQRAICFAYYFICFLVSLVVIRRARVLEKVD